MRKGENRKCEFCDGLGSVSYSVKKSVIKAPCRFCQGRGTKKYDASRVLFLDVDGVLNAIGVSQRSPHGTYGISPERMRLLRTVIDSTQVDIVLSSVWRKFPDMVIYIEKKLGGQHAHRLLGKTPVLHGPDFERGDEIQAWLDDHPEVTHFAIVDDDGDMKHLKPYLTQTDILVGLDKVKANQLIKFLNSEQCKKL